jgi:DNA-binding CsgD family transcriptional regulator
MAQSDELIATITQIHAAGLDPQRWPDTLYRVTSLIGGLGASLEFLERPSMRPRVIYAHGLDASNRYIEDYALLSPRLPHAARQPVSSIVYDGQYYDDADIDADPFYMEFLQPQHIRYFVGGVISMSPQDWAGTSVQFSRQQGHPSPAKIKLMQVLLPHFQQAVDVMRRLDKLSDAKAAFERTLDWLADGVVLVASDGAVRYANVAAQKIFRSNDGVASRRGMLTVDSADAAAKLGAAVKAVGRLRDAAVETMLADFIAPRRSDGSSYLISVRPLLDGPEKAGDAVALVFIHDPSVRKLSAARLLAQVFGLTTTEADVANALCLGLSPDDYARQNGISANTVYTHIRHLKDKTGSRRMAELIRKLNDVQVMVVGSRSA